MNLRKYIVIIAQVIAISAFKLVVRLFCTRPTPKGAPFERINRRPYLIVANHKHALDPFIAAAIMPMGSLLKMLPIGFMTLNFFYNSPLKLGLWLLGCFPARNKSGKEKLYGVEGSNSLIDNGWSLQIFPEGTRIRDNGRPPAYPGVIEIHKAHPNLPMVLCHIEHNRGLKALLRRRWFVIRFALEENVHYTDSNKLMDKIYNLPQEQQ